MEPIVPLRIVFVEDVGEDREMAERELRREGLVFDAVCVQTHDALLEALDRFHPDVIISDYCMPQFDGMQALALVRARDPLLPFIVLTGSMNEETAVECMKAGASDYVIKQHVTRLPFAVARAHERAAALRAEAEVEAAHRAGKEELAAIYQHAPMIMMLVDAERRVRKANGFAAEFAGRDAAEMIGLRGGEAIRCLHSVDVPEGCGFGPHCAECTVRRTVIDTLETGVSHHMVEASLPFNVEGREQDLTFLLSTARLTIHGAPHVLVSIIDMTERKKAERALRESESRYRELFEQVRDAISTNAPDGTLLDFNQAWLDLFGYTREEVEGFNLVEVYADPRDREDFLRRIAEAYFVLDEVRFKRKDGSVFICQRSATARRDEDGNIISFMGIIRDITAQKQAQEALKRNEKLLQRVFDLLPIGLWLADKDGRLLRGNPAGVAIWGAEPHVGPEEYGVFRARRLPSGEEIAPDDWALARTVRDGITVTDEMLEIDAFDGRKKTILNYTAPVLDDTGKVQGAIVVNQDITDRVSAERALRLSEERFRGVIETSQVGVAIVDTETQRFIEANPALLRLLGYTLEELRRLTVVDVTLPEDWRREQDIIRDYTNGELPAYEMEKRYIRKDGALRDVLVVGELLRLDAGGPPLAIANVLDITDRKRAEEELQSSRQELRALAARIEEARESERTGIARELHDQVGQALTAIKLDLGRLASSDGKTASQQALIEGMAKLVDQTADDVRRISSDLRPGMLDDFGLVSAMEWQLASFQEHSGIRCNLAGDVDESLLDRARSTALFRVFQELLTNVSRHSSATEVEVAIALRGGELTLTVADDGRGIPAEHIGARTSLGIIGMQERLLPFGGALSFAAREPNGTAARVTMPLSPP
jgi:PAS domain S-box-containing protein